MISFAVTTKLIIVFVFAYAKYWFSHDAAHIIVPKYFGKNNSVILLNVYPLLHLMRVKISKADSLAPPDSVTLTLGNPVSLTPENPVTLTLVNSDLGCDDLEMTGCQGHRSVYLCVICHHHWKA